MKFLHYDLNLSSDECVEVTLNRQVNVKLLDDANFSKYKRGEKHTFFSGLAKISPLKLKPPHAGIWHLVVDLGGHRGTVEASVRTIQL